jgi:hypothetical protein
MGDIRLPVDAFCGQSIVGLAQKPKILGLRATLQAFGNSMIELHERTCITPPPVVRNE